MFDVLIQWYKKNFSDPNAVTLMLVIVLTALVITLFGQLLIPVFVALVVAFLLEWPVKKVTKLGLNRNLSTTIVIAIFIGVMTMVFVLAIPVIWKQSIGLVKELPDMMVYIKRYIYTLPDLYPSLDPALITNLVNNFDTKLVSVLESSVQAVVSSLTNVVAILVYVILVPMMVFFILKDKVKLLAGFDRIMPVKRRLITQVTTEMNEQIINYIRGKMIELVIVGTATYIAFAIMDLRYAAVLGLLVGLSVLIPYIGAAAVTVPVTIVALFQFGLTPDFYAVMIAYGVIQTLDGNLLVPLLFSEAVDLNPVYIIVAVLFFGGLWGFWGVFFAIPLASLVKAVINAWAGKSEPDALEASDCK
ncbi:AI-2E family transporter [Psychrosphaera saromensis]|uniref:AI-2E family transporter n=1 Tax=Psychrosphaera saromensis TaxID=716813 RepID=A0A2S7UX71_9GAMM|nr:AI-2E family transporter [Psychrosphaera saromensis]PQJ54102.1 AI-2E family transporter [Psychrosphaera saromensis]GHB76846.1 AI-2E family transporter [Psychrosphaera saromensis]GLQ14396.1 AI-2E family transporter [Psychrosphaera saromensis]